MVFRVEKTKGYTVMSNHHLSNVRLSLKAKGLLSMMLSLPEDWEYTLDGLSKISKDGIDSIRSAIGELEKECYITKSRCRDAKGRLTGMEYVIHEVPYHQETTEKSPKLENPILDKSEPELEKPMLENPKLENPILDEKEPKLDFPIMEKPILENPTQSNTNILNTNNIYNYNNLSILSDECNNKTEDEMDEEYIREVIAENIEYEILKTDEDIGALVNDIYQIMVDVVLKRQDVHISGENISYRELKHRLMCLNSEHIKYIIGSIRRTETQVKNIRKYIIKSLYNAQTTYNTFCSIGIDSGVYRQ